MDEPRWERLHRSTDRRAIETVKIGTGRWKVLVLASLHGDESHSVELVDHLARYLSSQSAELRDASILIVRNPNPDGMAAATPYNARRVDLNRNFPCSNWVQSSSKHTGEKPASEVETRVLIRLIDEYQPQRLVHIKDSTATGFVNHDGGLNDLAHEVARHSAFAVLKDLGQATPGSIENYASSQRKVPSLTLLIPKTSPGRAAWEKHKASLVASIRPDRVADRTRPNRPDEFQSRTNQAEPGSGWTSGSRGTRLQSSLPATPPSFPAPVPERGYLELPPPPKRNGR